jgi:hypothetical protein
MAMDKEPHFFSELNSEIYAYSYHSLVSNVLETATGMKVYTHYFMEGEQIENE